MEKLKEFWVEYSGDFADLLVWVFGIWIGYNLSVGWLSGLLINPLQAFGVVVAILAVKTLWNK